MDESKLILKAEKFLNNIDKNKPDFKINSLDEFNKVYGQINENLQYLQSFKEKMDLSGYSAPFRSLNKYGISSQTENDLDDSSELARHNHHFRIKATTKKNILDRIKASIDAHKIVLGNLESYAQLQCMKCNKKYRPSKYWSKNRKCDCESTEFKFIINETNVYRLEILKYLPLSGNYMVLMSQLSNWGRNSLKKVLNILKTQRKSVVTNVSPRIKLKENGRWTTKRISLDSEFANSYEEELRKRYGKNFRIEKLDFHRSKPSLVNDKHTRKALALAYVRYSEEIVEKHKEKAIESNIRNIKNLQKYDQIIKEINQNKPPHIKKEDNTNITEYHEIEEWRENKKIEKLKENELMDKYGNLNRILERDIQRRKTIKDTIFTMIAPTLITWDIFKYYLTTSSDKRKRYTGPFPYLRNDIDRQQRQIFQISTKVVKILSEYENEKIINIPEMDLLLYEKFKFERKNSHRHINHNIFSAALIKQKNENISTKKLSQIFKVKESEIEKELKQINEVDKPRTNRSKKLSQNFLELAKKK